MKRYNPQEIEPRWQKVWAESEIYKTDMARTADKYYVIPFLPYPSGDLHVGHWYNYVGADMVARWRRMLGQNVLTTLACRPKTPPSNAISSQLSGREATSPA
jgi:leucyl-tRNA synthetase